jgi:hypothetical protein
MNSAMYPRADFLDDCIAAEVSAGIVYALEAIDRLINTQA